MTADWYKLEKGREEPREVRPAGLTTVQRDFHRLAGRDDEGELRLEVEGLEGTFLYDDKGEARMAGRMVTAAGDDSTDFYR